MEAFVTTEISSIGIATITFFHPAHNSMPAAILAQLTQHLQEAGQNEAIKVIVLKSSGERTFCAGASFEELKAIETPQQGKAFFAGFAHVINACRTSPKIIIGRVQGKAIGGGVGIAAATDYCFATQQAAIKLSELTIGIGPFVIAPAVIRKIGIAAFGELTLNATQFYDAHWAKQHGLYAEVYDDISTVDAAIEAFANNFTKYNPKALQLLKTVLWEGTDHWDNLLYERAATSGHLALSTFTKETLQRF